MIQTDLALDYIFLIMTADFFLLLNTQTVKTSIKKKSLHVD